MALPQKLQDIIDEFQLFDRAEDKYELLIEHGRKLAPYPDELRDRKHLVPGCVSVVYIHSWTEDGKVRLLGDADSLLVKGLVAVLIEGLDGMEKEGFLRLKPDFITAFGLTGSLTPSRANASINIFKTMQKQLEED